MHRLTVNASTVLVIMTRILWRLYTKRRSKTCRVKSSYQAHPPHAQTPMPGTEDVTSRDILRLLQPCVLQTHSPRATMGTYEISSCLYIPCVRKRNYFTDLVGLCVVYTINFMSISRCGRPQWQKNYVFLRCGRPMGLNASLYLRCGRPSC